jgi:hypothetical protein
VNTVKRNIACFCENVFEAEMPEAVDISVEPGIVESVLKGDFMSVSCPLCGKRLTPEYPCLFSGVSGDREIFLVPEADRVSFFLGKLPYDVGKPWRVAVGFTELAEKLRLIAQGLDDRVIEIMKYYLITRPSPSAASSGAAASTGAPERDVSVVFSGEDGGRLLFHVSGLKEGEVGVARLGRDIYDKISSDVEKRVKTDPFRDFCTPPHVSVRRVTSGDAVP